MARANHLPEHMKEETSFTDQAIKRIEKRDPERLDPEVRKQRIIARREARDRPKLEAWEDYLSTCREERPLWTHCFVDTHSR